MAVTDRWHKSRPKHGEPRKARRELIAEIASYSEPANEDEETARH